MSLRARTSLAIVLLVAMMSVAAWLVSARIVIGPFARAVGGAMRQQAVHIAEEVDAGVSRHHLEDALGVDIDRARHPPPQDGPVDTVRGRRVWRHRGVVFVESDRGLLRIRRTLDPERPARRLPVLLLFPAIAVVFLAIWIAGRNLVPLERATTAMRRVASGDLDHQLPLEGPSELREAAASFNAMTARVRRMLQGERELLAGLSHELRTPLTRLQLELSLLEDTVPQARLDRMRDDLDQLDALVGEALQLSRLQLGDRALEREDLDLNALFATLSHPDLRIHGAGTVHADPRLLERALQNLLDNAAKYAPGPVDVTLEPGSITLRDHGPGVPEAELAHLFHPFYRGSDASRQDGLGLGLMIVRQIVELHGARVEAHNAEPGLAIRLAFA